MKATVTICSVVCSFLSQFFHSRRKWSCQLKDLSTIHRLGITANLPCSRRLAISTSASIIAVTAFANFSPVYPPSHKTFTIFLSLGAYLFSISSAPSRSVTFAVVTCMLAGSPRVSTPRCIFIPAIFFPRHTLFLPR